MKRIIYIFLLIALLSGCTHSVRFRSHSDGISSGEIRDIGSPAELIGKTFKGKASYYADKFHGRTTANGETYDMYAMTCAHKKLPFGTMLRVTNLGNGRTVIVRVNDRGPYVDGRILDLSLAAARKLDMIRAGVVEVEIEVIEF